MAENFVSVIIPTYNDWARLAICVKALSEQTYPKEKFEVIIVNNNAADQTPAGFSLPANFTIITEAKPGSYAARNAALKIVNGDVLAFTDSDCIPDKKWIENAVAYFSQHEDCSRIAGSIAIFPNGPKATTTDHYNTIFEFPQVSYAAAGTGVTANLFTYKKVFDAVGPFDDKLFSLGDLEWGKLAHKAGFKIHYVANVIVKHPSRTLSDLITKVKRIGGGQAKFEQGSKFRTLLGCVNDVRPKYYIAKQIFTSGHGLGVADKIKVLFLRHYLLYIRAAEKFKVVQGKQAERR